MDEKLAQGTTPFTVDGLRLLDSLKGIELKCFLYLWASQVSTSRRSVSVSAKELSLRFGNNQKRVRQALLSLCSNKTASGELKNPWVKFDSVHATYSVEMPNLAFDLVHTTKERPGMFSIPNYIFFGTQAWMLRADVSDTCLKVLFRIYFLLHQGYTEPVVINELIEGIDVNGYKTPPFKASTRSIRDSLALIHEWLSPLDGLPLTHAVRIIGRFEIIVDRENMEKNAPVMEEKVPPVEIVAPTMENIVPDYMEKKAPVVEKNEPVVEAVAPQTEKKEPSSIYSNSRGGLPSLFLFEKNKTREYTGLVNDELIVEFSKIGQIRTYPITDVIAGVMNQKKNAVEDETRFVSKMISKARRYGCCSLLDVMSKESGVDVHNWLASEEECLRATLVDSYRKKFFEMIESYYPMGVFENGVLKWEIESSDKTYVSMKGNMTMPLGSLLTLWLEDALSVQFISKADVRQLDTLAEDGGKKHAVNEVDEYIARLSEDACAKLYGEYCDLANMPETSHLRKFPGVELAAPFIRDHVADLLKNRGTIN